MDGGIDGRREVKRDASTVACSPARSKKRISRFWQSATGLFHSIAGFRDASRGQLVSLCLCDLAPSASTASSRFRLVRRCAPVEMQRLKQSLSSLPTPSIPSFSSSPGDKTTPPPLDPELLASLSARREVASNVQATFSLLVHHLSKQRPSPVSGRGNATDLAVRWFGDELVKGAEELQDSRAGADEAYSTRTTVLVPPIADSRIYRLLAPTRRRAVTATRAAGDRLPRPAHHGLPRACRGARGRIQGPLQRRQGGREEEVDARIRHGQGPHALQATAIPLD